MLSELISFKCSQWYSIVANSTASHCLLCFIWWEHVWVFSFGVFFFFWEQTWVVLLSFSVLINVTHKNSWIFYKVKLANVVVLSCFIYQLNTERWKSDVLSALKHFVIKYQRVHLFFLWQHKITSFWTFSSCQLPLQFWYENKQPKNRYVIRACLWGFMLVMCPWIVYWCLKKC